MVRRQADREMIQQLNLLRERRSANHDDERQRRRAIRHHCAVSLALRVGFAAGSGEAMSYNTHQVKGRVLDLSPTGCAVFTREPIPIGTEIGLIIHLEHAGDVPARGVIRWSKGVSAREGYACGIQFTGIQAKERDHIAKFLKHLDENIGL